MLRCTDGVFGAPEANDLHLQAPRNRAKRANRLAMSDADCIRLQDMSSIVSASASRSATAIE
jgi:hypothetical protein